MQRNSNEDGEGLKWDVGNLIAVARKKMYGIPCGKRESKTAKFMSLAEPRAGDTVTSRLGAYDGAERVPLPETLILAVRNDGRVLSWVR